MAAWAAVLVAAVGCGQSSDAPPATDGSKLRGVIRCYQVASGALGRPPQNMEELQAPLQGVTDDPAQYFRSTRDGQEFVVVWGLHRLSSLPPDTIVAYERTGVNGKRMVVDLEGNTPELTEEEFAKLEFPKDHTPGG